MQGFLISRPVPGAKPMPVRRVLTPG
jgi:hypothetical protein